MYASNRFNIILTGISLFPAMPNKEFKARSALPDNINEIQETVDNITLLFFQT